MKTRSQMLAALEAEVDKFTPDVGKWVIRSGPGYVQIVWGVVADDMDEVLGDKPWTEWGGNSIIWNADMPDPDDTGVDTYTDKHGDDIVTQWAQWNIE